MGAGDGERTTGARGTGGSATTGTVVSDRGVPDPDRDRREAYLDTFRASLIDLLTPESFQSDEALVGIPGLLMRARNWNNTFFENTGPKTRYRTAVNLLRLYEYLAKRAEEVQREADGTLLHQDLFDRVGPWTPARPRRVEDIEPFKQKSIELWNAIASAGPPPDEALPLSRRRPRKATPIPPAGGRRRRAGFRSARLKTPPFLPDIIQPGGPDARLVYTLLKTPDMTTTTADGRLAIMEAIVARVLSKYHSDDFASSVAYRLMEEETAAEKLVSNLPEGEFEQRSVGSEFTFEVGVSFLLKIDQASGGAVPYELIRKLDNGSVSWSGEEAKPIWQELYPHATTKERAFWVWKRIEGARTLYDASLGRPKPGTYYPGNGMIYVSDGMFAGDQIWVTPEMRIYQVNERALLLEAFRIGVIRAAGAVALAYVMIGLSLVLVEGPAILSMLGRLGQPATLLREFMIVLRTRPLSLVGEIALDQGIAMTLAGGFDNYIKGLKSPEGWIDLLLTVLGATKVDLHIPRGGTHGSVTPDVSVPGRAIPGAEVGHVPRGPHVDVPAQPVEKAARRAADKPDAAALKHAPPTPPPPRRASPASPDPDAARRVADARAEAARAQSAAASRPGDPAVSRPRPDADTAAQRKAVESQNRGTGADAKAVNRRSVEAAEADVSAKQMEPVAAAGGEGTAARPPQPATTAASGGDSGATTRRSEPAQASAGTTDTGVGTKANHPSDIVVTSAGGGGGGRRRPPPPNGVSEPSRGRGGRGRSRRPPKPGGGGGGGQGPRRRRRGGGRAGGAGTTTIEFSSGGVRYRITVTPEARAKFDSIPVGDTVVYTIHDANGTIIYVGITQKGADRTAVDRLYEHLYTKEGEFVGEAASLRIRGHYDEMRAHALEQDLVSDNIGTIYNKDLDPWQTYLNGTPWARSSRRPPPGWQENVPRVNQDFSFDIDFN